MRPTPIHKSEAFTLNELIVVIVIIAVVFVMLAKILPWMAISHGPYPGVERTSCVNNLKQIGTSYHLWANDHNGHFPASESVTNEGWRELLTNASQGFLCWTNYAIMKYELGQSPKLVMCPSDERKPADVFTNPTWRIRWG